MSDSFVTPWTEAHQAPLYRGFPGKNIGVGYHFLLQGVFLTQVSNPRLLCCQAYSFPLNHQQSSFLSYWYTNFVKISYMYISFPVKYKYQILEFYLLQICIEWALYGLFHLALAPSLVLHKKGGLRWITFLLFRKIEGLTFWLPLGFLHGRFAWLTF